MKLNKKYCTMFLCEFSDISHILRDYHYKSNVIGGGIYVCFAMAYKGELIGGSVLGLPRHSKRYPNAIDIRRMACLDQTPTNTESWFLGSIIRWITCNTNYNSVLSYSDLTKGHKGTIYKASNFKCIGQTPPTKEVVWKNKVYHPRSLSIDRDYSYKLREALKAGEAEIITGKPKNIWMYIINPKKRGKAYSVAKYTGDPTQTKLF